VAVSARQTIVVKLGGEVVRSAELALLAGDLTALAEAGHGVVVVHGGGPQATELQKALGQTPKVVAGRRITDAATLEVMKMAVAGQVNVDLCAAIVARGGRPVGLHGASSLVVRAEKRPPRVVSGAGPEPIDFGHVGDVKGVRRELVELLVGGGYIPVVACLGADEKGQVFNINADIVASEMASTLSADALFLVTDVPAVLRDVADPSSRIARMTVAEAKELITEGVVTKGMIPKLDESFAALARGVGRVHILGKTDLLRAIQDPSSVGTVLVRT